MCLQEEAIHEHYEYMHAHTYRCFKTHKCRRRDSSSHGVIWPTCTPTNFFTYTYVHIYIHTYTHTYINEYMHTYVQTCTRTNKYTKMRTNVNAYIRTYEHTYTHTNVQTHRPKTQWPPNCASYIMCYCTCRMKTYLSAMNTCMFIRVDLSKDTYIGIHVNREFMVT